MGFKFNPFTGNFDQTDSPDGVFESVEVDGDITLDDGGSFTTTLQTVTATANRTISFPDATGTIGLVAGSSGQLLYNNAGAYSGLSTVTTDGTNVTLSGRFISSLNGAASAPPGTFTGTWFTGGTSTTTKPQVVIEPTGATSTSWSTSGTGIGVNAASGFAGNLLDLQLNGTSRTVVTGGGNVGIGNSTPENRLVVVGPSTTGNSGTGNVAEFAGPNKTNGFQIFVSDANNNSGIQTKFADAFLINPLGGNVGIGVAIPSSLLHLADAGNITVGTTTGTQIGTAAAQKLGFFGVTPVVQQTELTDELTTITHTAPGTADFDIQNLSLTGYGFVTEDEGNTVLSVIANLQARVNELETKLVALGFLADAD